MGRRAALAEALDKLEAEATAVVLDALEPVLDKMVANVVAEMAPMPALEPVVVASVSWDILTDVLTDWGYAVDFNVLDYFGTAYQAGGLSAVGRLLEKGGLEQVPKRAGPHRIALRDVPMVDELMDRGAAAHLATARDRFLHIGDQAWKHARLQMLQGFEQGEGIDQIAARLRGVGDLTKATATMVARTEVVAAANAGSVQRMAIAAGDATEEAMPYKQWLSTLDSRTRPTHVTADGQVVEREQSFFVGGAYLAYPGDPAGGFEETVNCRCTILWTDDPGGELEDVEGRQEGGVLGDVSEEDLQPRYPGDLGVRQADAWMEEHWPSRWIDNRFFLTSMHPDAANDVARTLDQLFRDYPEVAKNVGHVGSHTSVTKVAGGGPMKRSTWADANQDGTIRFNQTHFGKGTSPGTGYNNLRRDVKWNEEAGFHPVGSGSSPVSIVEHEFGHQVYFEARRYGIGVTDRINRAIITAMKRDGWEFTKANKNAYIRDHISGYATKSPDELVAEAFSHVRAVARDPRIPLDDLSEEIVNILNDWLQEKVEERSIVSPV